MPVRIEQPGDRAAVVAVHRAAFGPSHGPVVAELVAALHRDDPGAFSLVSEESGEIAGNVLFTRSLLDAPPRLLTIQVLSPLAVAPPFQGRGIGSALVRAGLRHLDERGVPLVFLEGDPRYYSRFGFLPGGEHGFRKPSLRVPDAAFQVVKLSAFEPWMTGTLVYSHTFWDYDCVGLREDVSPASKSPEV
jgi:putative acetyltransferase